MAQEQKTVVASKRWNIDWRDLLNGALIAVYGAVGTQLATWAYQWATRGGYKIEWSELEPMIKGAAVAIGAYLVKKFTEQSKIVITSASKETIKAIKSGDAEVKVTVNSIPLNPPTK